MSEKLVELRARMRAVWDAVDGRDRGNVKVLSFPSGVPAEDAAAESSEPVFEGAFANVGLVEGLRQVLADAENGAVVSVVGLIGFADGDSTALLVLDPTDDRPVMMQFRDVVGDLDFLKFQLIDRAMSGSLDDESEDME
ncbi:hypothetical protein F1188_16280 [Roseospira marina]|uniref:Uncharacterized protein n=1 Tax=Roseospira marina TaxID=140057 RepID=A0A5M6I901_9PROT|nr:hypothetical protein [Roseospira marina]KAA5604417.1 hypothetical protein F1188_16280 [Roseospira marina]MBB4315388.1 hypothetical protein [Roseospira marina]MBB5088467.1 hypothetical protein [Roseospira marina]